MWRQSGPIVLFILGIVAAFVYFGNAIPQTKSERVEAVSKIGALPEELVTAGKRLFLGDRAQCLACHSLGEDPKARCPNLEGVAPRAAQRKPGSGAAEYLVESLYNPNAYTVPGYPRNQMTPVHKPPIALAHDEILAVIVFLNSLGGRSDEPFIQQVHKAQAPWRQGLLQPEAAAEAKLPILPGDASRGAEIFQRLGCVGCHRAGAEGGHLGPDLTAIGASQSAQYILESCLDPNAVLVKGFKQLTVVWTNPTLPELQGLPLAWIPNKEHPQMLRLSVNEEGVREEKEIDLSKVAQVGDTVVIVEKEGKPVRYVGEYVSGDEKTGVTLLLWEQRGWVERRIPAAGIQSIRFPSSPMPAIFGEAMTPRETYDLLAYLLAQKGRR